MKVLLTGFAPFGGEAINPSYEALKLLPREIGGAQILTLELPTAFEKSAQVLEEVMLRDRPNVVLCIGQAGGRSAMTPERVAINLDDAPIPDNDGQQPLDKPIQIDGQPAYFSKLPIKAMVEAMRKAGVPAEVSNTAGTFVCNHIMYQLLYRIEQVQSFQNVRAGFMHIPYMTEQTVDKPGKPSLPLETIALGIEVSVMAILANIEDRTGLVEGKLD